MKRCLIFSIILLLSCISISEARRGSWAQHDSVGTRELDDSGDTPVANECVAVSSDTSRLYYTSCGAGGGIDNVVEDTTPQLGGNLDAQAFDISDAGVVGATTVNVSDDVYAAGWNSSVAVPTKNAVYDKMETLSASGGGTQDYGTTVGLVSATDDFAIGATDDSAIFFDESAGTLKLTAGLVVGSNTGANLDVIRLDLDSDQFIQWDDTNKEWDFSAPVNASGSGQSILGQGLIINNDQGATTDDDFTVNSDTQAMLFIDASESKMVVLGTVDMSGVGSVSGLDGRSLTVNSSVIDADTELYTRMYNFSVINPLATHDDVVQIKAANAFTISRVSCSTDAGTVTIQLDERVETTPNTAGTDIMTSNLACDTNMEATTAFDNAGILADSVINMVTVSTASLPTSLRVHIDGTYDD